MRMCCLPIRLTLTCWRRNDYEKDSDSDVCLHVPCLQRERTNATAAVFHWGSGLLYRNGMDVTFSYEHEMNYQ